MAKILGIDYGKRRTGVAISDSSCAIAFPKKTLKPKNEKTLIADIKKICAEEYISTVVIGLPCNMKGEYTPQTDSVVAFSENLKKELGNIEIKLFDERLSTIQAERALIDKNLKKYSEIDEIAAQIILQAWLDKMRH